MQQNFLKLTILIVNFIHTNQIKTSYDQDLEAKRYKKQENIRSVIISGIEGLSFKGTNKKINLEEAIPSLLKKEPRYGTGEIPLIQNVTLSDFIIQHRKFSLLSFLTKDLTLKKQNQSIDSSPTSSGNTTPISHAPSCKKSSLACAFTCDSSTCNHW